MNDCRLGTGLAKTKDANDQRQQDEKEDKDGLVEKRHLLCRVCYRGLYGRIPQLVETIARYVAPAAAQPAAETWPLWLGKDAGGPEQLKAVLCGGPTRRKT